MKTKSFMSAVRRMAGVTMQTDIMESVERWSGRRISYYQWTLRRGNRTVIAKQRVDDIDSCDAFVWRDGQPQSWDDSSVGGMLKRIVDVRTYLFAGGDS